MGPARDQMPGARRPQSSGSGRLGGSRGGGLSVDQLKMSQRGQNSRGGLASTRPSAGMGPPSAEKESRYHVEEAVVLRHQSEVRRSAATELGSVKLERSNEAIRERIRQTQEQKQALQDVLREVLEQSQAIEELDATIDEINEQELEIVPIFRSVGRERKTRMMKNAGQDEVDYWLRTCCTELEASLFPKLLLDMRKLASAMAKLSPELTRAIEEKADAVVVDLEVLNMDPSNVAPRAASSHGAGGHQEPGNTRRQNSVTQQLLEKAELRCQQSASVENKVVAYAGRRAPAESLNSLLETYHAKIDEGNEEANGLQECLEEVEGDLESCNQELEELSECIKEQSEQLQVTQTRLRTRSTNKPARERTYDRADAALEAEEDQLMKAITKLHLQQKKLRNNRQRLLKSIEELHRQLALQEDGLNHDAEALAAFEERVNELTGCLEAVQ